MTSCLVKRSARALGENYHLCLKIVTRLKVRFGLIVLVDALIIGADASNPVAIEKQFRPGEAGKHRNSGFFHFTA